MIVSPNKLVGMLVYRTREALNQNHVFMRNLKNYEYYPNCVVNGKFNLWHYVGTPTEISGSILNKKSPLVKFPCILDFKPNTEDYIRFDSIQYIRTNFRLAIAASSFSNWTTEQREVEVFEIVLRPVYEEFIRQIRKANNVFEIGFGIPDHRKVEVYTTGNNKDSFVEWYGETIDAIELHNLNLNVTGEMCARYRQEIEDQNSKVTESINQILNC